MDQSLILAIVAVVGAIMGVLTWAFVRVTKWAVRYFRDVLKVPISETQGAQFEMMAKQFGEWVAKQAVLATEQAFKNTPAPADRKSEQKLVHAMATARSLAPAAMAKIQDDQLETLIEAQVAALKRGSVPVPMPSMLPSSAAAPEFLSLAAADGTVHYTRSVAPPNFPASSAAADVKPAQPVIPPPSRLPTMTMHGEDPVTKPEKIRR